MGLEKPIRQRVVAETVFEVGKCGWIVKSVDGGSVDIVKIPFADGQMSCNRKPVSMDIKVGRTVRWYAQDLYACYEDQCRNRHFAMSLGGNHPFLMDLTGIFIEASTSTGKWNWKFPMEQCTGHDEEYQYSQYGVRSIEWYYR